jgi:hypothetical protein
MMTSVGLVFAALWLLTPQQPSATQAVGPSTFVGTWVGLQSWALDNPGPGAKEDQEVTLTIELVDGKLVGAMTPFFGGADGATFTDVQIVGEQLLATAVLGKPKTVEFQTSSSNLTRDWKPSVHIRFAFQRDRNSLKGTADVDMTGVNWLKFKYDLSRKRSRY